jgi:hypothetical protein
MELRFLPAAILVLGGALGVTGCGGYGSICQDAMDCVGGNDNDVAACENDAQALEDKASLAGCDDEYGDYLACFEDNATCHDNQFNDRGACSRELERLGHCADVGGGL